MCGRTSVSSYSAIDRVNPGCTVLCRVKKDVSCHDIEAYEEPLMHGQQGSILHLPCNTGGLQGISQKSLQHHITGMSCMQLQLLPARGFAGWGLLFMPSSYRRFGATTTCLWHTGERLAVEKGQSN